MVSTQTLIAFTASAMDVSKAYSIAPTLSATASSILEGMKILFEFWDSTSHYLDDSNAFMTKHKIIMKMMEVSSTHLINLFLAAIFL
jgi:hypothetical protein